MKNVVDARGLACPQPVVLTLKAISTANEVTTIVDNRAAVENVTRLAQSKGCSVQTNEKEDGIYLTITGSGASSQTTVTEHVVVCSTAPASAGPLVLVVPSDCFGRGPAELGEQLMGALFNALLEVSPKPQKIIFLNSGVKLMIEGSHALDEVQALEEQGVEVLTCGTCLDYFGLREKLATGKVSNMYEIATALMEAGRIVQL